MESDFLKLVSIRSKGHKKQLLLSHLQQDAFAGFLKPLINNHLMVINTNLGLDVYYHSIIDHQKLIVDTFLLYVAERHVSVNDFHIKAINKASELKEETRLLFLRLVEMPLFFKSYTKSLFYQMGLNYDSNQHILSKLFALWQEQLLLLNEEEEVANTFRPFLSNLQKTYIQNYSQPDLKRLLQDALAPLNVN